MNRYLIFACLLLITAIGRVSAQGTTGAALVVTSGARLGAYSGGYVVVQAANVSNAGVIQSGGGSSLVLSGGHNVSVGGSGTFQLDRLVLALGSGDTADLTANTQIGRELVFSGGQLNLDSSTVTLASDALLVNESDQHHALSKKAGSLQITKALHAPSAANPGNLGTELSSAADLGNTTIRRTHVAQTASGSGMVSISRWFAISPANNSGLDASLKLYYLPSELNGLEADQLSLWEYNNGSWINLGESSISTSGNYIEQGGLDSLGSFSAFTNVAVLPLQLTSLNASCEGSNVLLNWTSSGQSGAASWVVQKSADGASFKDLGTVAVKSSSVSSLYSYTDRYAGDGTGLYRIVGQRTDGSAVYSPVLKSSCNVLNRLSIWPNPATTQATVSIHSSVAAKAQLMLRDNKGILIRTQALTLATGVNQITIDLSGLARGGYVLSAEWGSEKQYVQILKL